MGRYGEIWGDIWEIWGGAAAAVPWDHLGRFRARARVRVRVSVRGRGRASARARARASHLS